MTRSSDSVESLRAASSPHRGLARVRRVRHDSQLLVVDPSAGRVLADAPWFAFSHPDSGLGGDVGDRGARHLALAVRAVLQRAMGLDPGHPALRGGHLPLSTGGSELQLGATWGPPGIACATSCFALSAFAIASGAIMIRQEDRELEARFGDAYQCYRRSVPSVIPHLRFHR